jgi:C-terminal processing protease CtpA/Prc
MRYLSALLIATAIIANPAAAASPKKIDCEKDLKEAARFIYDYWSFKIFKPGAVDVESELARHMPQAKRAETPEECADVLAQFMSTLGDGHSSLHYFPGLDYTAPAIEIRSQRERLSRSPGQKPAVHAYVFSRDTTDEALRPLLPGSEILEVDSLPVADLYRYWAERVSGSTPWWIDYKCDQRLLRGPAETEIELTFREPGGARKTLTVRRPPVLSEDELERERDIYRDTVRIATWERLENGWGYLKYTTFAFGRLDETIRPFDQALESLMDAPGLIIDLRGNGGGYVDAVEKVAGRFMAERTSMGFFNRRYPGQEAIVAVYDDWSGGYTDKPRLVAAPRTDTYTGPVVILVDRTCFSACEMFTAGLQAAGRALVIGPGSTGGGSGFVAGLRLPSGAIISFSYTVAWRPDGQIIEGYGVAPDIKVGERARDWAVGRDRVLERAIRALERGEAPSLAAESDET